MDISPFIVYLLCAGFVGVFVYVTMNIQSKLLDIISPTLNILFGLFIVLTLSSIFTHVGALLPTVTAEKLTMMSKTIEVLHDMIKVTIGGIIGMLAPGRQHQEKDGNGNDSLNS